MPNKDANAIVLFTNDKDADALLIKTLMAHYQRITVVQRYQDLATQLKDELAKVFLVSGEKFQDTLATFYSALDLVPDHEMCDHFFVSLVSRHDEAEAYEAYRNGIIDDYLVARPLYEIHRPIVICDHLLIELGMPKEEKPGLEFIYTHEKYADNVRAIVAKGLERKEQLKQQFQTAIDAIERSLDGAAEKIQQNQTVKLDIKKLEQTLQQIKSDHIRPELLKLQSKAISLLQAIVVDTEELAESTEQAQADALAQTKPTIVHNKFQEQPVDVDALLAKRKKEISVLLVEDDPISVHLTSQTLSTFNVKLDTAFTGRRALACIKSNDYDLILLDITLPDSNGLYLLDQLKLMTNNSKTPVVILSGNRQKKVALKTIEMGAKSYIVKPLRKDNFVSICKKLEIPLSLKK
jgi:CheY-like chemotaxis protein